MVPEWALKHKVKNSELRKRGNRYHVYAITSKWSPALGRPQKKTLPMLGSISEKYGFVPSGEGRKGRPPRDDSEKDASKKAKKVSKGKEYGATSFIQSLSSDILTSLKKYFSDTWQSIFVLACIKLRHQAPLMDCKSWFEKSYLSETMLEAKLEKSYLTDFLKNLGNDRENIAKFMKDFVEGSQNIVFDTSHLTSYSKNLKMAKNGYNSTGSHDPQVNLFYMFSTDKQAPVYYRIFPGNISGASAFKLSVIESGIRNCIVIGDKCFYSKENIQLLDETGLEYILPLRRNIKLIRYEKLKSEKYDGVFEYQGRPIFYVELEEKEGKKVVVFKDKELTLKEENAYTKNIFTGLEGYDIDGLAEERPEMGTIAMITNCLEKTPEEIYLGYKTRMEVETVFDTYKNELDAGANYMQSNESLEGMTFVNHLATLMYYKIFDLLKKKDMLKKIDPQKLLNELADIEKTKIDGEYMTTEITAKTKKLMKDLGFEITS